MPHRININIVPSLWFDDQAEEAVAFYVGVFDDAQVLRTAHYGKAGQEIHGRPEGSVMTIDFEIAGKRFTALNGGPVFQFNEAVSFQIMCDTQEQIDRYWSQLTVGGDERAQQCGWLKDKYGVSWQLVPNVLADLVSDPDSAKSQRAFSAMMQMKKLDIAALKQAYAGQ